MSLIFPKNCLGCGKDGKYLCQRCLDQSKRQWPICPECKILSPIGKTHAACKKRYGLDGLVSIYKYGGVVRKAIGTLKYKFSFDVVKEIAMACAKDLGQVGFLGCPVLIPIPLHIKRKNWRGFNQSEEVGKVLSEKMGWGFENNILARTQNTKPQVGLEKEKRLRNLSGKFAVNNKQSFTPYKYLASNLIFKEETIVIFDDVWTTGSTMKEACKALKEAGFKKVWGMTIAR